MIDNRQAFGVVVGSARWPALTFSSISSAQPPATRSVTLSLEQQSFPATGCAPMPRYDPDQPASCTPSL